MLADVHRPEDCALGVAVPLTREDFSRDLDSTTRGELAKEFARDRGAITRGSLWKDHFQKEVDKILDVASEVASAGVRVIYDLTLSDLAHLIEERPVTAIAAHWRSGHLRAKDVVDREGFYDAVRRPRNPVYECLSRHLPPAAREMLVDRSRNGWLEILVEGVNDVLVEGSLEAPRESLIPPPPEIRLERNRELLQRAVPGVLTGGSALELRDGMHSAESIIEVIPETFGGVLDLTVCHSLVLGERIKKERRHCRVLVNRRPATLAVRMPVYRSVIRRLSLDPVDYVAAVLDLREAQLGTHEWREDS